MERRLETIAFFFVRKEIPIIQLHPFVTEVSAGLPGKFRWHYLDNSINDVKFTLSKIKSVMATRKYRTQTEYISEIKEKLRRLGGELQLRKPIKAVLYDKNQKMKTITFSSVAYNQELEKNAISANDFEMIPKNLLYKILQRINYALKKKGLD